MKRGSRLPKMHYGVKSRRLPRVQSGVIMNVRNLGSIWQFDVRKRSGEVVTVSGDARMIGDGLLSAFGSVDNAVGKYVRFTPDPVFGASSWEPED